MKRNGKIVKNQEFRLEEFMTELSRSAPKGKLFPYGTIDGDVHRLPGVPVKFSDFAIITPRLTFLQRLSSRKVENALSKAVSRTFEKGKCWTLTMVQHTIARLVREDTERKTRRSGIIHMQDPKKKLYYLCNHAVGQGSVLKLTTDKNKVTCKNCLQRLPKH